MGNLPLIRKSKFAMLFFAGIAVLLSGTSCAKKAAAPQGFAPPNVIVAEVKQQDVPIYGEWVATLDGYVNANIQPQVSGYLIRQDYREGSYVRKGDVLFEIDPRPFQATLNQAKGQLAQAKGQLGQAEAQLGLAKINVKRDTPLAQVHAIAQSQLDNDIQTQKQNEALILGNQASIETAQAAVETATLNLGFTKVRSLIDGIAGQATTQIGNLVGQTTVLTAVSQVNPIKAYFPISEQEYLRLADKIKPGSAIDLLQAKNPVPLQLTLANNSVYPFEGRILFADRQVDPSTGTIRIVAAFRNPGNVLRPGQFGRIRALTSMQHGALLVPQSAIGELQGHYQVAVIGPGNKASIRPVQVGDRFGSSWIVASGLKMGEEVVSEGTSKVRDGIVVNPTPQPPDNTAPTAGADSAGK